jgi:hypothetical protein
MTLSMGLFMVGLLLDEYLLLRYASGEEGSSQIRGHHFPLVASLVWAAREEDISTEKVTNERNL